MTKTLLAVDDSVTMRKVLEITFSGEDFRVLTAENAQSALGKLSENPSVFVVDTQLGGEDGYALAKELRRRNPAAAIILLASRYAPYDQGRGRDAGADDFADKPFDTQQLIDKVRKIVGAKEAAGPVAAVPAPVPTPQPTPGPVGGPPRPVATPMGAGAGASFGRGTQPSLGGAAASARTGTLVFGDQVSPPPPPAAAPRPVAPAPPAPAAAPTPSNVHAMPTVQQPVVPPAASQASGSGAVATAVNGHLGPKLDGLGLSPQQADAVLALSRDVVEKVVWEVVPQLAEALIKEEIARLMKA